jgi:uncharacterized protein YbjT (DUF2867 family)
VYRRGSLCSIGLAVPTAGDVPAQKIHYGPTSLPAGPRMVLLIGGTRGTGLLIARRLRSKGVPIRVLARNPSRAAQDLPPGVELIAGDITKQHTIPQAIDGATHVVLTAGVRSGYPATEALIKTTEYEGVLNVLAAARRVSFEGRFLYMTSSGVTIPSLSATLLNLYKGKTLTWRQRAEEEIRASGLDYTVIRAGVLLNRKGGLRTVRVTQDGFPLSWRYRIARADVADAFVASLDHPCTSRTTFEVVWGRGFHREPWELLLNGLCRDVRRVDAAPTGTRS